MKPKAAILDMDGNGLGGAAESVDTTLVFLLKIFCDFDDPQLSSSDDPVSSESMASRGVRSFLRYNCRCDLLFTINPTASSPEYLSTSISLNAEVLARLRGFVNLEVGIGKGGIAEDVCLVLGRTVRDNI